VFAAVSPVLSYSVENIITSLSWVAPWDSKSSNKPACSRMAVQRRAFCVVASGRNGSTVSEVRGVKAAGRAQTVAAAHFR